jgi:hypothetical protein
MWCGQRFRRKSQALGFNPQCNPDADAQDMLPSGPGPEEAGGKQRDGALRVLVRRRWKCVPWRVAASCLGGVLTQVSVLVDCLFLPYQALSFLWCLLFAFL